MTVTAYAGASIPGNGWGLRRIRAAVAAFLMVLLASPCTAAQPGVKQGQGTEAPSLVEIPIRIPLDQLFEMAEGQMPLQAGNWRDWRKSYGIKTKYRAWRGPLYFTMQGEVLVVQAHVRYWIKAHKKVLGALNLRSSCGVDEPPRQALIGVMIHLGWAPDWTLRPEFRVIPTRFLDRCEMTIADIDVTPLIGKEFQNQLEDKMRAALTSLRPQLSALRQQVERSWRVLQQPVDVGTDHWLLVNPEGIALSPLLGHGDSIDAQLAVVMRPNVVSGSAHVTRVRPLPPLMRFYPQRAGLNLQMVVKLDYSELSNAISGLLAAQSIDFRDQQAGIEALELSGQGREIRVKARLTGSAAGSAMVKANITFSQQEQTFKLQDLDYTFTPKDPLLAPEARLFYNYIRKALEVAANRQLQQRMDQWKEGLVNVLDEIMPEDAEVDVSSLQLSQATLNLEEHGISVSGLATGHILFGFR
jgi:hypothetical protein